MTGDAWIWQWLLAPLLVLVGTLAASYLWNEDFFWYLTSGRAVLENGGGFPTEDPFLYTSDGGIGWVYHSWLWTVLAAVADRLGGLDGVVIFHTLVALALFALVYRSARADRLGLVNGLLTLYLIVALRYRVCGKAEMASWLLLAIFFLFFESGKPWTWRRIALLAGLQILWANLHGGYPLGVALALCYSLGGWLEGRLGKASAERPRPPIWLPALLFLAAVADPRLAVERLAPFAFVSGASSFQPVGEAGNLLVLEWRSPFDPSVRDASMLWIFALSLVVGAAGLAAARRLDLPRLFFVLGLSLMGASAIRHLGGMALAAVLVALASLGERYAARAAAAEAAAGAKSKGPQIKAKKRRWQTPSWVYAAACVLVAVFALSSAVALRLARAGYEGGQEESFFTIKPAIAPKGAADYILENDLPDPIFNDYPSGAYLAYRLYPKHRLFVDSRVMKPSVVVDFTEMMDSADAWKAALERYQFRTVVLGQYSRALRSAIGASLQRDPEWRLVYADPLATVWVRGSNVAAKVRPDRRDGSLPFVAPAALAGPLAWQQHALLNDTPGNYLIEYLANLGFLNFPATVRDLASRALVEQPDNGLLYRQRCAARLVLAGAAEALPDCEKAHALRGDDPQVAALLASVLRQQGARERARAVLDDALRRHPDDRQLRQLRGQM